MSGMLMLDIVIGLSFVYFLLSVICSGLIELFAQWRNLRGKMLDEHIEALLGTEVKRAFDRHPLVSALRYKRHRPPGEIPDAVFTKALHDVLAQNDTLRVLPHRAPLASQIEFTSPEQLKQAFSNSIARLSGHYRRHTQRNMILVAFIVVFLTGTDSITLLNRLHENANLRAGIIGDVSELMNQQQALSDLPPDQIDQQQKLVAKKIESALANEGIFKFPQTFLPDHVLLWLTGTIMTIAAIQMGAEYWFNMLIKLFALRKQLQSGGVTQMNTQEIETKAVQSENKTTDVTKTTTPAIDPDFRPPLSSLTQDISTSSLQRPLAASIWLAYFAKSAYLDHDEWCPSELNAHLFEYAPPKEHNKKAPDVQVWLIYPKTTNNEQPSWATLAFRGTEPLQLRDWLTDIQFKQVKCTFASGFVHRGFLESSNLAWINARRTDPLVKDADKICVQETLQKLNPACLWLTGHSLGGALAALTALRADDSRKIDVGNGYEIPVAGVVTFGQPRVGDSTVCHKLDQSFGVNYLRFVNHRDMVPRVPPRAPKKMLTVMDRIKSWLPFQSESASYSYDHGGHVCYFDRDGKMIDSPTIWQKIMDAVPVGEEHWHTAMMEGITDHDMRHYCEHVIQYNQRQSTKSSS